VLPKVTVDSNLEAFFEALGLRPSSLAAGHFFLGAGLGGRGRGVDDLLQLLLHVQAHTFRHKWARHTFARERTHILSLSLSLSLSLATNIFAFAKRYMDACVCVCVCARARSLSLSQQMYLHLQNGTWMHVCVRVSVSA